MTGQKPLYLTDPEPRPGVYKITCLANSKIYIGGSANIRRRWDAHCCYLRNGTHQNQHLLHAWRKYGPAQFTFEVVEYTSVEAVTEREQQHLDATRCYERNIGFNKNRLAARGGGWEHGKKSKVKNKSAWIITTPEGREEETTNLEDYCKAHGLASSCMRMVADCRCSQHRGGWKCRRKSMTAEEWQRRTAAREARHPVRVWVVTTPTGVEETVIGLKNYCRERGLRPSCLISVADVRTYQHRGYLCRRDSESKATWEARRQARQASSKEGHLRHNRKKRKRWIVTHPGGKEETVIGLAGFCKRHGLHVAGMHMIAVGRNVGNRHHGFRCRPADVSLEEWQRQVVKRRAEMRVARKPSGRPSQGWIVTHPDGCEETVTNLRGFCAACGVCYSDMLRIANGQCGPIRGFTCRKASMTTAQWRALFLDGDPQPRQQRQDRSELTAAVILETRYASASWRETADKLGMSAPQLCDLCKRLGVETETCKRYTAQEVCELHRRLGMSRAKFATALGVSRCAVDTYEKGTSAPRSDAVRQRVAELMQSLDC